MTRATSFLAKRSVWLAPVLLVAALVISRVADAHHSFAAVFDGSRTIAVEGVVSEFRLVNPHALMTLESKDASGRPQTWIVEFDGRLNLTTRGWKPETIAAGEHVTVYGNPAHADAARIWFLRLERPDGSVLLRPAIERNDEIEEARRQRAAQ
jgi:uncharacterized protein DUF6152